MNSRSRNSLLNFFLYNQFTQVHGQRIAWVLSYFLEFLGKENDTTLPLVDDVSANEGTSWWIETECVHGLGSYKGVCVYASKYIVFREEKKRELSPRGKLRGQIKLNNLIRQTGPSTQQPDDTIYYPAAA